MMAATRSSAPPTAIPTIRNGNRISQTKGYAIRARSASGQQKNRRTHHRRNLIIFDETYSSRTTPNPAAKFPDRSWAALETHDVVAGVNEDGFAGDAAGHLRGQENSGATDFQLLGVAVQRRAVGVSLQHVAQAADAAGGESLNRSSGDSVHANILLAQVRGKITHRSFECCLCDAHHVVVRHNLFRSVVCQSDDAAAIGHEWSGTPAERDQRVDAHVVRDAEAVARRLDEVVLQLFRGRKTDGVDQHVELAVTLFDLSKDVVDLFVVRDVALKGLRPRQIGDQLMRL